MALAESLEKARQYKAVLALYKVMVRYGYDFYENSVLNGVFKRLVSIAAKGVDADIDSAARELALPASFDDVLLTADRSKSDGRVGANAESASSSPFVSPATGSAGIGIGL